MAEAQQAAKQAERDRAAANRTTQQAQATCTNFEAEVQRLHTALSRAQQGQRYSIWNTWLILTSGRRHSHGLNVKRM